MKARIMPLVEEQLRADCNPITVSINEPDIELSVTIKRNSNGYSSGGFASYSSPQSLDRNPLYNALRAKRRKQLKDLDGVTGIVVCDGDTECLRKASLGFSTITGEQIIEHFLSQNSSIDFVFAISVHEEQQGPLPLNAPERLPRGVLRTQPNLATARELERVLRGLMSSLPPPVRSPVNGANQATTQIPRLGFHGGGGMNGGGSPMSIKQIKISSRELIDVLSGELSFEQWQELRQWKHQGGAGPGEQTNPFKLLRDRGQLPVSMTVVSGDHRDDDWVEIDFGPPDPAISKFR